MARAGRRQAGLPAGVVRGRRVVLCAAAQHDSGLLLDTQRTAGERRPADAAGVRCRLASGTGTRWASTRSSSRTVRKRSCSPNRSGSAVPSRRSWLRSSAALPEAAAGLDGDHVPGLAAVHSCAQRQSLGRQGMAAQAQHRPAIPMAARRRGDPEPHRRPRCPGHRDGADRRAVLLRARRLGDRCGCAAGVQPASRHRRPRVHHQRLRQPQHRGAAHSAGDGDAA